MFLLVFRIVRSALLMQGLASGMALLATATVRPQNPPPWLAISQRTVLLVSTALFVAGLLMVAASRVRSPREQGPIRPPGTAPLWLGLSLVALPVLSYAAALDLVPLWGEITQLLDRIGFWDTLARADPFGGIVVLPILAALFVPILETAAAFFLIVVPAALVVLLLGRSGRFAPIFAMLVACQAGLVVASLLASDGLSRLTSEVVAAMPTAEDVEVARAAELLRASQHTLTTTARSLVAPMLAYVAWLAFLLRSPALRGFFGAATTAGAETVAAPAPRAKSVEPPTGHSRPAVAATTAIERAPVPAAAAAHATSKRAGRALVALGAFMLAFGAMEQLRSRARYVRADPKPGAVLTAAPALLSVVLDRALDPSSSVSVTRTSAAGENGAVARRGGLDARDPERKTLATDLSGIPTGVYRAAWTVVPDTGGVVRHGSYYFAVGPTTSDAMDVEERLEEDDAGTRQRRHTFVGGLLLSVLGAWSLVSRRSSAG